MSVNIYVFVVFLVQVVANVTSVSFVSRSRLGPPGRRPPGSRAEGGGLRNERQTRGPRQRATGGLPARGRPVALASGHRRRACARLWGRRRRAARAADHDTVPWYPAEGDWLSGRAPRSHRGGHWFDPSIAHPAHRPVPIKEPVFFDARTTREYSNVLAAKPLAKPLERVPGGGRGDLGVDLHRHGDLAVPQDLHGYTWVYVQGGKQ